MDDQYNSVRLLHMLADEFKALNLPFQAKMVERLQMPMSVTCPPRDERYVIVMEINSECSEEEFSYIREFACKHDMIAVPMMDFENLKTSEYFANEEEAFNFNMSLEIKHERKFVFSISISLEDTQVGIFIEAFRSKTEPLRLKAYEAEFTNQVDSHLVEDEYNLDKDDNGHK